MANGCDYAGFRADGSALRVQFRGFRVSVSGFRVSCTRVFGKDVYLNGMCTFLQVSVSLACWACAVCECVNVGAVVQPAAARQVKVSGNAYGAFIHVALQSGVVSHTYLALLHACTPCHALIHV
jgi:hypothetical protein